MTGAQFGDVAQVSFNKSVRATDGSGASLMLSANVVEEGKVEVVVLNPGSPAAEITLQPGSFTVLLSRVVI